MLRALLCLAVLAAPVSGVAVEIAPSDPNRLVATVAQWLAGFALAHPDIALAGLAVAGGVIASLARKAFGAGVGKLPPGVARHAALTLGDVARIGFLYVESRVAPKLRGPDGKLSPEAGETAKGEALKATVDWLGKDGWAALKAAYGKSDAELAAEIGVEIDKAAEAMPSITPAAGEAVSPAIPARHAVVETLPSGEGKIVKLFPGA